MIQLLYALLAIVILSLFLTAGINYTDLSALGAKRVEAQLSSSMLSISEGWSTYYSTYGRYPGNLSEASEAYSNVSLPKGFEFTAISPGFVGWCFEASLTEQDMNAVTRLANNFSNNYGVSDACGYRSGVDPDWLDANNGSSYPKPAIVTYFFATQY